MAAVIWNIGNYHEIITSSQIMVSVLVRVALKHHSYKPPVKLLGVCLYFGVIRAGKTKIITMMKNYHKNYHRSDLIFRIRIRYSMIH